MWTLCKSLSAFLCWLCQPANYGVIPVPGRGDNKYSLALHTQVCLPQDPRLVSMAYPCPVVSEHQNAHVILLGMLFLAISWPHVDHSTDDLENLSRSLSVVCAHHPAKDSAPRTMPVCLELNDNTPHRVHTSFHVLADNVEDSNVDVPH